MKALTVWQPWASLIMIGAKPFEFRRWAAHASLVGQRIVIHAGSRPMKREEVRDLNDRLRFSDGWGTALKVGPASELIQRIVGGFDDTFPAVALPLGAGLGTVTLGSPRKASAIFGRYVADSGRIDECVWAWPMESPEPFEPFIPARGAQGFWEWRE